MEYTEVKIYTSSAGVEHITYLLADQGYDSLVIEDGEDIEELLQKKEHYWWDYVDETVLALKDREPSVTLYIEKDDEEKIKVKKIRDILTKTEQDQDNDKFGRIRIETRTVRDEDWMDKWKEYFKPVHVSDRIVVKPTWESYTAEKPEEIVIEIDPGMAFGTGAHPTTTMCIRLLENYKAEWETALDVGCGSGILSVAAALLGAKEVTAVDIDPVAVQVTSDNAALNRVQDKIKVCRGDLTKGLSVTADVAVANLMAEIIVALCADIREHINQEGIFISSGILTEKQDMVENALRKNGFKVIEVLAEDGWCAVAAKRNGGEAYA